MGGGGRALLETSLANKPFGYTLRRLLVHQSLATGKGSGSRDQLETSFYYKYLIYHKPQRLVHNH